MSLSFRSGLVSLSFLFVLGAGAVTGCARAPVGVTSNTSVPSDSANICAGHCESIGLQLSSVVVMANNVGCVCAANYAPPAPFAPPPGPPSQQSPAVSPGGAPVAPPAAAPASGSQAQAAAAAAGGMAAILMQEEEDAAAAASQHNTSK